ncbi:MAG: YkgJ family cysteine cluster protein [Spirochaetales bacterium]|uniref:YkgJ family cysteine cluster protein n=1 Tax=Candidatus Thalassospirochaeta sargassi TaxID=3119039 RepID=A0AAJ1IDK2_9SPIO|nr:YkgJ family cysteine cluster protein [Spirochaetales bacterium]
MSEKKFYENGLQFECQRCSACCRHEPGYVFLSKNDLDALVDETGLSEQDFLLKYCRTVDLGGIKRISLIEKKNYDCIFWTEEGCRVYKARPVQCRTYPFWISYLEEEKDWKDLAKSCPGVGKGPIVSKEEIEKRIAERQDEQMLTV